MRLTIGPGTEILHPLQVQESQQVPSQVRRRATAVVGAHHGSESPQADIVTATLVGQERSPAGGPPLLTRCIDAVGNGPGAGDDDHALAPANAAYQSDERVVLDAHCRERCDGVYHRPDSLSILRSVGTGHPQADSGNLIEGDPRCATSRHNRLTQGSLGRFDAHTVEVGRPTAATGQNVALSVHDDALRLCGPAVNSQDVGRDAISPTTNSQDGRQDTILPYVRLPR